jgi:hypothetical protein
MQTSTKADTENSPIITQFYYSRTLPYLIGKHQQEIQRRLKDIPEALRQRDLAPQFEALGETSGDAAWQVFREYLDSIERCISEIVRNILQAFGSIYIDACARCWPIFMRIRLTT